MISDYICGSSYLGLALESPAADEHDVMEMDAAAYTVFWVLTQHVPEADAGLKSPLPMPPTLEDNAWLQADIPSFELFLSVPWIIRVGIDVVCIR